MMIDGLDGKEVNARAYFFGAHDRLERARALLRVSARAPSFELAMACRYHLTERMQKKVTKESSRKNGALLSGAIFTLLLV